MTFPLHIGFTGPRDGMTAAQWHTVRALVHYRRDWYAHHGDCVGSDKQFDEIVRLCPGRLGVVIHPCTIAGLRAHCTPQYPWDVVRDAKPPLDRNQDIVDESHCLIATPKEIAEQRSSGTWSTIRRARRKGIPIVRVLPDGGVFYEGPPWP